MKECCNDTKIALRDNLHNFIREKSKKFKHPILKYDVINSIICNLPETIDQLKVIKNIPPTKLKKYGDQILDIIKQTLNKELDTLKKNHLWVIFDLETTGLSPYEDEIIQLCVKYIIKDQNGQYHDHLVYTEFISCTRNLPFNITQLTGIKREHLKDAPSFEEVYKKIRDDINFIVKDKNIDKVIWFAHNGARFDYLFWFNYSKNLTDDYNFQELFVDTYEISKNTNWSPPIENHRLNTIYRHIFNKDIENAHRADMDVIALSEILMKPIIKNQVYDKMYQNEYFKKKISKPPRKSSRKHEEPNMDILKKINHLVTNSKLVVIGHLNHFISKYPNCNQEVVQSLLNKLQIN